MFDLLPMVKYF